MNHTLYIYAYDDGHSDGPEIRASTSKFHAEYCGSGITSAIVETREIDLPCVGRFDIELGKKKVGALEAKKAESKGAVDLIQSQIDEIKRAWSDDN